MASSSSSLSVRTLSSLPGGSAKALDFALDPPSELLFQESTDKLFQQTFAISNPHAVPLAFKIKTTCPKHYCVRPNVGVLPPAGSQTIEVLLQPRKDKFLVLGIPLRPPTPMDAASSHDFWSEAESTRHEELMEKRLKCVFTVNAVPGADSAHSPSVSAASGAASGGDRELAKAHERLKRLELLLAETKRKSGLSSGIVPAPLAGSAGFLHAPAHLMFPPGLVAILVLLAVLLTALLVGGK